MQRCETILTEDAERDLSEIFAYIAAHDTLAPANHVLDRFERAIDDLSSFPERGSFPKELLALGIRDYRQAFLGPYRLIYRVIGPVSISI
jgi:toxin ParE1/3/4